MNTDQSDCHGGTAAVSLWMVGSEPLREGGGAQPPSFGEPSLSCHRHRGNMMASNEDVDGDDGKDYVYW